MKIQKHDRYHGAALAQVVKHEAFKALNRASTKFGHYLVNTDIHLFIRYLTSSSSPWQFCFEPEDIQMLNETMGNSQKVFLCLVCGDKTICALEALQIQAVLDIKANSKQSVSVKVPNRGSCHVSGSNGSLDRTIPHDSFPSKLFD